jgi:hypothetical protein
MEGGGVAVAEAPPDMAPPVAGAGVGAAFCTAIEGDKGDGGDGGKKPEDWKGVLAEFTLHVLRSYAPIYIYI